MYKKIAILLLLIAVVTVKANAQNIEYGVRFDTTQMLIGDQQNLTYIVRSELPLHVKFPVHEKEVAGLEIISGPVLDSAKSKGIYTYTSTYKITTFDTGLYVLPPESILLAMEGFDNALTTDSVMVIVNTLQVDKEKGLVDIQPPHDTPVTFKEILPYILYSLLGLLLIAFVIYIILRKKAGKPIIGSVAPPIPPYDTAVAQLQQIEEGKLWQAGREKEFYTELTNTLREYLDGELGLQCMESTTAQIVDALKDRVEVNDYNRNFISELLSAADLVKFAKMLPLQDENFNYMKGTEKAIQTIHEKVEEAKEVKGER